MNIAGWKYKALTEVRRGTLMGTVLSHRKAASWLSSATLCLILFTLLAPVRADVQSSHDKQPSPDNDSWYSDYNFAQRGVVGYWPLDGTPNDVSGNQNDAPFYGGQLTPNHKFP